MKTLFFDVDGTLYDETHAKVRADIEVAEFIAEAAGHPFDAVWQAYIAGKNAAMYSSDKDPAANDRARWYAAMIDRLPLPGITPEELAQRYWAVICNHIEPYFDLVRILPTLAARYDLCIITDELREIQLIKLERLGLASSFRIVTASTEVGAMKPWPELFHYALKKAGAKAENSLMIGDNPRKDIRGAKAVGMRTALLRRGKFFFYDAPPEEQADILITNYIDLPQQLEEAGF